MSKRFYVDLLERTAWTAFEAGAAVWLITTEFNETTLKAAGLAAAIAAVKCVMASRVGNDQSAAALPGSLD